MNKSEHEIAASAAREISRQWRNGSFRPTGVVEGMTRIIEDAIWESRYPGDAALVQTFMSANKNQAE